MTQTQSRGGLPGGGVDPAHAIGVLRAFHDEFLEIDPGVALQDSGGGREQRHVGGWVGHAERNRCRQFAANVGGALLNIASDAAEILTGQGSELIDPRAQVLEVVGRGDQVE